MRKMYLRLKQDAHRQRFLKAVKFATQVEVQLKVLLNYKHNKHNSRRRIKITSKETGNEGVKSIQVINAQNYVSVMDFGKLYEVRNL